MDDVAAQGPLAGLVVADFSRVLAGPYATMLLADLGANVIKVERPGTGDDTRGWGPPFAPDGSATYFAGVNRNKRSVALDLADDDGRSAARALMARADVVVENFRPGALARLGLGYDGIREVNPGVVYCSISGFGTRGGAGLPGYDLVVQAVGGLMSVTGPDPDHPTKVGVALVDVVTGLHAATGILSALHERSASGRGQHVEVNLMSSLLSALVNQSAGFVGAGVVPVAMGNAHPSIAPYAVYRAADRPMVIAVGNDQQFRALADCLGDPAAGTDPRFATNTSRVGHRHGLDAWLNGLLRARGADEWLEALSAAGVPCGPVNSVGDAFALAERLGLDPVIAGESPQVASPIRLSRTPVDYRLAPPALGADTAAVLEWLAAEDRRGP